MTESLTPDRQAWPNNLAWQPRLILGFFCLLLWLLGGCCTLVGVQAIDQQRFEMASRRRQIVEVYQGADATRMGVGVTAFGTMLVTWGCALLIGVMGLSRWVFGPAWGLRSTTLTAWSLLLLLTAAGSSFPPWHFGSSLVVTVFYSVLGLMALYVFVFGQRWKDKWGGFLFVGLIIASMVAAAFSTELPTGMVLALLVFPVIGVHVVLVIPGLRKLVDVDKGSCRPRHECSDSG